MMIFMNFVGGLQKLNSIQNDVFFMSWSHRDITKVILDQFRVTHFLSFFIKNLSQKKMPSDVGNISFFVNRTEFGARILKFMIFSCNVFKGFKF